MEMGDGSLAEPNFPEQLKCILHLGEDTSEPVKKFSQKCWIIVDKKRWCTNFERHVTMKVL
jgi:hypothetical protein